MDCSTSYWLGVAVSGEARDFFLAPSGARASLLVAAGASCSAAGSGTDGWGLDKLAACGAWGGATGRGEVCLDATG